MSTNIRVFVEWKDPIVFAGEDLECIITFKNISAPLSDRSTTPRAAVRENGNGHGHGHGHGQPSTSNGDRQRTLAPPSTRKASVGTQISQASRAPSTSFRGHRPTLSLNTPSIGGASASYPPTFAKHTPIQGSPGTPQRPQSHGRSLSIISLGSEASAEAASKRGGAHSARRSRGHGRSASLQVVPGRGMGGLYSPSLSGRNLSQPSPFPSSPLIDVTSPGSGPHPSDTTPPQLGRRPSGALTTPNTPALPAPNRKPSGSFSQNFKFPMAPPSAPASQTPMQTPVIEMTELDMLANPRTRTPQIRRPASRATETAPAPAPGETLSPVTRILAGTSMAGTPRSSGEFYAQSSNHSTETLASDYVAAPSSRLLGGFGGFRRVPQTPPVPQNATETLMMGYAQIMGSFTVDGSLINQAPFEEVKRKGVVGGQGGGGVVGVERTKRESSLFGSFGWGSIGESLGGLLGSGELSSIKEMRAMATSKAIPLITTPQTILFVDLRLAPGESRRYRYTFRLPKGLPPTHKGRAFKTSYHLTIGTQRPGTGKDAVRQVEIPFRVFGSVTSRGEILGHDLMSPYILLRDQARTVCLDEPGAENHQSNGHHAPPHRKSSHTNGAPAHDPGQDDFLDYVARLLDKPGGGNDTGLLSPTVTQRPSLSRHSSRGSTYNDGFEEPQTMKEAIDLAILRSTLPSSTTNNPTNPTTTTATNRFTISRNGHLVCTLQLPRPAYRLGESIPLALDFAHATLPTYAVDVALESRETVDPALALRSAAAVARATTRVHAVALTAAATGVAWATRLAASLAVPALATPEFVTSGVGLEWVVRVGFVTARVGGGAPGGGGAGGEGLGKQQLQQPLLEELGRDERGFVLGGVERLLVEGWEVCVPVRVYGAVTAGGLGGGVAGGGGGYGAAGGNGDGGGGGGGGGAAVWEGEEGLVV